ncbi:hypothetical protein POM88_037192 [Heracleum sosnowskyi]|uniref:Uncharacterized protein n=1 Tax=Heracleum sosnowskyi TaxID=360622 RepID=A0AAD8MD31_9APIA|nr:hypothetical protein POM88_037192 [Heracleum sosnowskyi]
MNLAGKSNSNLKLGFQISKLYTSPPSRIHYGRSQSTIDDQDNTVSVLKGIYDTIKEHAVISKLTGIGVSVHDIHDARIYSRGTDGASNNAVPVAEFPVTSTVKMSLWKVFKKKVSDPCAFQMKLQVWLIVRLLHIVTINLHKNVDIYRYPIETARRVKALTYTWNFEKLTSLHVHAWYQEGFEDRNVFSKILWMLSGSLSILPCSRKRLRWKTMMILQTGAQMAEQFRLVHGLRKLRVPTNPKKSFFCLKFPHIIWKGDALLPQYINSIQLELLVQVVHFTGFRY